MKGKTSPSAGDGGRQRLLPWNRHLGRDLCPYSRAVSRFTCGVLPGEAVDSGALPRFPHPVASSGASW